MAIYASDPHVRPDDRFESGTLAHLAAGARGRLLDPRRTPVSVIEVRPTTGFVLIRIEGFEDEGATWEIPLEHAGHYQFERGGPRASDAEVTAMEQAVERFAREELIGADPRERERTERHVARQQVEATDWLGRHSHFIARGHALPHASERRGDPELAADFEAWLRARGVWDVEQAFARVFVSNPGSGEMVKGHRIVIARLGLADYAGGVVRDPDTFAAALAPAHRAEHIVARLSFVRALFERLGMGRLTLWRGLACHGRWEPRAGRTFVSATFDEAVAREHFESGPAAVTPFLAPRTVTLDRVFMTYHETAALNDPYREAEAVLLALPDDRWP